MSGHNRCAECYNIDCIFITGERTDLDTSKCIDFHRMTNADKIRAMTDEKMAEFLSHMKYAPNCSGKCHNDWENYGETRTYCDDCWLDWLKKEAKK